MKARCRSRDNGKGRKVFSLRPLLSPGGYLLSRDLSSDYHRRADVSLPGSEWDRVGPSGYDHQASVSCDCIASTACPGRHFVACSGLCVLLFLLAVFSARLFARRCFQQADIRVARGCLFLSYAFALTQGHQAFDQRLVTRVLIEVYWMLVALGSIHYCNYTCALSTWSSSTLL